MYNCELCDKAITLRRVCNTCTTRIRRYRVKLAAVQYLGGKCMKCGYSGSIYALEFHHRDPKSKQFTIGHKYYKNWEVVKSELDKCDLLCSNCHRDLHSHKDDKFVAVAKKYKRRDGILSL